MLAMRTQQESCAMVMPSDVHQLADLKEQRE
jgi:hypothetical protein